MIRTLALLCVAGVAAAQSGTRTVAGRVVDMLGNGIPVAQVHVARRGEPEVVARATTDGEGTFRIPKVPDRRGLYVYAQADGFCRASLAEPEPRGPVVIRLAEVATLTGVLQNAAGEPAAGVEVFAQPTGGVLYETCVRARTDANGGFVLRSVPLTETRLGAWIDGEGLQMALVTVTGDAQVQLERVAEDLTTMAIRVDGLRDEERALVRMRVCPDLFPSTPEQPYPFCFRGAPATGTRIEHLPNWRYLVWPEIDGLRFTPSVVTVEAGTGPHDLVFTTRARATQTVTVRAVLRDPDGQPVRDVRSSVYGPVGTQPVPATSDADGRIECVAGLADDRSAYLMLRDDRWLLAPTEPGDKPSTGRRFTADPETAADFRLVPACVVEGRILRPDGTPAPFAQVDLERDGSRGWQRVRSARADRDGAFVHGALTASTDELRLVVSSEHGCLTVTGLRLAVQGDHARVGDLTLGPPGALSGVIRTRNGEPAIGAVVQLVVGVAAGRGQGIAATIADSKGRFRFAGLAAGDYRLTVSGHGVVVRQGPPPTYRVNAGETVEVELEHAQR